MNKKQYAEQFGRLIEPNEIVFDVDNREYGIEAINFIAINLFKAGYKFEVWYTEGGKSPHLHIKKINGLNLKGEQLREYKKLFIRKYTPHEYLHFLDIQICSKHRIAEEDKLHYKYKKPKKLMEVWNEDSINDVEDDLYEEAIKKEEMNFSINPDAIEFKDQVDMTDLAKYYGLKVKGNMAVCPWHADKSPSLSLSNKLGLFNCFSCNASGNILKFVEMLEELKNGE